ncbi:MAG: hypothetical protein V2A54_06160 [Bacteroidota bacterium]
MKKCLLILILFSSASLFAQGIRNTSAKIVIQASAYLYDNGNYLNESTEANHGTTDSDGNILIAGNRTNNETDFDNKVFTGLDATEVVFNSACAANSTAVARVAGTQLTGNIPGCAAMLVIESEIFCISQCINWV